MSLPYHEERRKIIKEHLDRFPDAGSRTIARIIYRDYAGLFKDIEDVRTIIRYYRGARGDANRSELKDNRYVKQI